METNTTPKASALGIPYASVDFDETLGQVRICPVCDERVPENTDADGETVGNPYGEHYAREHFS